MVNDEWIVKELPEEINKEIEKSTKSGKERKDALKKAKQDYITSQVDPGEAIGIVTAQSLGEPGTQMSVHKDEKIIVKRNNKIRITKISNLIDGLMKNRGALKFNNSEILPINELEFYVPSLNKNEKVQWKKVVECSRHYTDKKLMQIKTASGRKITSTDNHSFVTRKNNEVVPISGKELEKGDYIPVINYLPEHCIASINPLSLMSSEIKSKIISKEKNLYFPRSLTSIPENIELDDLFGYFVGAYLAEGHCGNGELCISNLNKRFLFNIKKFSDKFNFKYKEFLSEREFGWGCDLKIRNSVLCEFMRNICNSGSKNKMVPQFAYSAKEEFVSGLLRGYFDGDGNVHVKRKMIRVSSNSEDLIKGVSLLLNRFRIFSFKVKNKKGQHGLIIPYKYSKIFLEKINSSIQKKKKCLEELADLSKNFWNVNSQEYTDVIPGFSSLLFDTAKKLGMPTRYVNSFTNRQKIGRTTLLRHIKNFEKISKEKNVDISKDLGIMRQMFSSEVVWDAIKEIKYIPYSGHVYDLSVDGLETFTTFEGIVTHNTMRTFHFAGVSALNVTLGLPRVIEILDARKNPKTPVMDIYLKKEFEKDENKVKELAQKIKECKLIDVSKEISTDINESKIHVKLDKESMKDKDVKIEKVVSALKKKLRGTSISASGSLGITIKVSSKKIRRVYHIKEKAKGVVVSGIKKIEQALPSKEGEGKSSYFMIKTAGSNLKKVLAIPEIDETRTKCNDLHEINKILGIEAARSAIIDELIEVLEKQQGFDVDFRYVHLIADTMCFSGNLEGVTRHGIIKGKRSVLARASFETPIKHLVDASIIGEKDKLTSVVENVMLNQEVPLGTGLPKLIVEKKEDKK